jgi:hypothetical protein
MTSAISVSTTRGRSTPATLGWRADTTRPGRGLIGLTIPRPSTQSREVIDELSLELVASDLTLADGAV